MLTVDETVFPLAKYQREPLFNEIIYFYIRGIASEEGLDLMKKYLSWYVYPTIYPIAFHRPATYH